MRQSQSPDSLKISIPTAPIILNTDEVFILLPGLCGGVVTNEQLGFDDTDLAVRASTSAGNANPIIRLGGSIMRHKLIHLSATLLSDLGRTVARIVVTTFVLTAILVFSLRYLGIPVPSPYQLLHDFERLF